MDTIEQNRTGLVNFNSFRPIQDEIIDDVLLSDSKFVAIEAATGCGKSVVGVSVGLYESSVISRGNDDEGTGASNTGRFVYAVGTKTLTGQLMNDFAGDGMVEMKGKNNYPCVLPGEENRGTKCDKAPCSISGYGCELRRRDKMYMGGCPYYDALWIAKKAGMVVTNYTYLLNMLNNSPEKFGKIDVLICDEAHDLVNQIQSFATVRLTLSELKEQLGIGKLPYVYFDKEDITDSRNQWAAWARGVLGKARSRHNDLITGISETEVPSEKRVLKSKKIKLENIISRLETMSVMEDEWVCTRDRTKVTCIPVWPGKLADKYLFNVADKVILLSATMPEILLDKLNIPKDNRSYSRYSSEFSPERSPIISTGWCRLNYRTGDDEFSGLVQMIDEELSKRDDVKILIQAGSYARVEKFKQFTEHKDRLITHGPGGLQQALQLFLNTSEEEGPILISPAAEEGLDLKNNQCRCIIYIKFPFSDTRDAVNGVRNLLDPDYTFVESMIRFEQGTGRATRSKDDWSEVIVTDANWGWIRQKALGMGLGSPFFWDRETRQSSGLIPLKEVFGE